jgi:small subunit ribosomal protein S1
MRELLYEPEGSKINMPENKFFLSSLANMEKAAAAGHILEAPAILCDREKNLHFDLGGVEGVMEKKETMFLKDPSKLKDIAVISRVNRPVCFKIKDIVFENGKEKVLLSRKDAQEECLNFYFDHLSPGDILRCKVTHLEPFGAFCDIGCGVTSLIGIENISVSRISHAKDRFFVGQDIFTAVLSLDEENLRLSLTHKELLGTWEENAADFKIGETVTGIVRSVESYGIFTELTPNLSGLAEYKDNVFPGQQVSVFIKNIIPEKSKIKLIIINSFGPAPVSDITKFYKFQGDRITDFRYLPENSFKL